MNSILTRLQADSLTTGRPKNSEQRGREYLTTEEMDRLLLAAQTRGRHPERDYCLLLLSFRHGLRVSEALALRWDAIALDDQTIYIERLKNSKSGLHPLQADELEALRLLKERKYPGSHLFVSERGKALTRAAINKLMTRCAELAELDIKAHPHMLRHACGYYLANQGYDTRLIQEWLGHRSITSTEKYTALNAERFKGIQWT